MSKSTKNRSKRSTNISGGLQKEIQALIAYACYDSPSLIRRGGSLGESAIENKMTSIFYGEGTNGADPNLITYDDQFLLGLNKFKGLYTQSVQAAGGGPTSSTGEVILSIPAFLHRHKKLFIYVGEGSIDKAILSQKSLLSVGEKISGRTLHRNAKTVLCNCKKMMAIVTRKGSPYRDGKFPSGTNWEDYILWCLIEMGKECDRAEAEKIDSVVVVATNSNVAEGEKANGARGGDVGFLGEDDNEQNDSPSIVANSSEDSDEADRYPDKTFFRCGVGFLAWALWGHIPIHNSACMQSDSFGDLKKNASVGRKVASRAQMRKLMIAECAASVDNRRGRKRRVTEDEVLPVPVPFVDSSSKLILAKTLQYLNADSLEKERQKNAQYMIRSVRDKLTARRRNEDSMLRELDRFAKHKKKPGEALIDKRDALEREIAALEEKLDNLQSDECRRHSDMLKERSLEILATSSSSDAATTIARSADNNNQSSSADSADEDEDDVVDVTPAAAAAMHTIVNEGWCIECNTPSNHSCRKCKKCVCSLCCGQRELENVWWCNACFSTQTVANQQLIRDGNYDSDDDEEDN